MKKTRLLNSEISYMIAGLGHQDMIVIGDCGLPVPKHVKKIDIALTKGVPGFLETLQTVLSELHVERVWIADELKEDLEKVYPQFVKIMEETPIESLPHEDFKKMIYDHVTTVIRTGECTPFANVILKSGVIF